MDNPFRFDAAQVRQYFERVHLPIRWRRYNILGMDAPEQREFLKDLQQCHLRTFATHNLIHRQGREGLNLNPQHLFDEIVHRHGRGGSSAENNTLFHYILVSLGFEAYMTMAGTHHYHGNGARYEPFRHCLNIVAVQGGKYLVDVGSGPKGPTQPLLMESGEIHAQINKAQNQLIFTTLPENFDLRTKYWVCQWRKVEIGDWATQYVFADEAFTLKEVEDVNKRPPPTWADRGLTCVKFVGRELCRHIFSSDGDCCLNGVYSVEDGELRWCCGLFEGLAKTLESEEDEKASLKGHFGIIYDD